MPDKANLELYQGDDYFGVVTIVNDDGTPADIDGHTAKAQIRKDVADEARRVEVEITTSVASPDVHLEIPRASTRPLSIGSYVWDLELTSPEDNVTTVLAGVVTVTREVTR